LIAKLIEIKEKAKVVFNKSTGFVFFGIVIMSTNNSENIY